MSKFPPYPGATFSEADVENYLGELSEKGWGVFKNRNEYIVVIDNEKKITTSFSPHDKEWRVDVSFIEGKRPLTLSPAVTFQQFQERFAKAAEYFDQHLEIGPQNIRLREGTPVSNKTSIASLVRGNAVMSVFDPYFDDKSIATLVTLANLGMSLNGNVRILTTSKVKPRLSLPLINDFKAEKGVNLEVRFCSSDKEHRRYLLLSSGESVVIGCS